MKQENKSDNFSPEQNPAEIAGVFNSAAESAPSPEHFGHNEDFVICRPDLGLFGVFDSFGGPGKGNEAGRLAAKILEDRVEEIKKRGDALSAEDWRKILQKLFVEIRKRLVSAHRSGTGEEPNIGLADTTASVAKIVKEGNKTIVIYGSVGDSRIYLKSSDDSIFGPITKDDDAIKWRYPRQAVEIHRLLDEAKNEDDLHKLVVVKNGLPPVELRYFFYRRNFLSRTLADENTRPQHFQSGAAEIRKGGLLILTSDGIHDNLTGKEIKLIATGVESAEELVRRLIETAGVRSKSGTLRSRPDDMSAVAVML